MTAVNVRGASEPSSSVTQYAGPVPSSLTPPTVVAGSRTLSELSVEWYAPGVTTTDVIGYRLYVNDADSNAVPTRLVFDGSTIDNVFSSKVTGLELQKTYWFAYQVRNRAGWSDLSLPYLKVIAGPLPSPPPSAPIIVATS